MIHIVIDYYDHYRYPHYCRNLLGIYIFTKEKKTKKLINSLLE